MYFLNIHLKYRFRAFMIILRVSRNPVQYFTYNIINNYTGKLRNELKHYTDDCSLNNCRLVNYNRLLSSSRHNGQ